MTDKEVRVRFPSLPIASLGAMKKDNRNRRVVATKVLFDGTNGVALGARTKIRDKERAPIAVDLNPSLQSARTPSADVARSPSPADVSEAHHQVPIAHKDWHFLIFRVEERESVNVSTVGNFGVASASNFWARRASALRRLSQCPRR